MIGYFDGFDLGVLTTYLMLIIVSAFITINSTSLIAAFGSYAFLAYLYGYHKGKKISGY